MNVRPRRGASIGEFWNASAIASASRPWSASGRPSPLGDVDLAELDGIGELAAGRLVAMAQDHDAMPAPEQLQRDRPADEAGPAGDTDRQWVRVRCRRREDRGDRAGAVPEDLQQLAANGDRVGDRAQRPERQLVGDLVVDPGSTVDRREGVLVLPAPVRALELPIHERMGRVEGLDARAPQHRQAEQRADSMVDLQARSSLEIGRDLLEAHRSRGDPAEVVRAREEREDLLDRAIDGLAGKESVGGHGGPSRTVTEMRTPRRWRGVRGEGGSGPREGGPR